ncbi:NAD(P)-binding protein [Mycena kentingensis (nom. inval.)]|nr:NAD(P)-binding protein [Mycena kentingensis (nom. inval.)]
MNTFHWKSVWAPLEASWQKNLANYRASHLPGAGPILVWNRTASKGEALRAELGQNKIWVTASLEQIATECDVVFTALANDEVMKEVSEQLAKTLKATPPTDHKILVATSTIYPTLAGELDALVSSIPHCHLVASLVFGTPAVALGAQLVIAMCGDYWSNKEVAYMLVPAVGRKVIDLGGNIEKGASFRTFPYLWLIQRSIHAQAHWQLDDSRNARDPCRTLYAGRKVGYRRDGGTQACQGHLPRPNIVRYSERMSTNDFIAKNGFSINGGIKDASHIRRLTVRHLRNLQRHGSILRWNATNDSTKTLSATARSK